MPDDRYQTADAPARDLALLRDARRARGPRRRRPPPTTAPTTSCCPTGFRPREGARHDLQDAVARACAPAGSAIAVVGPAGAGKTAPSCVSCTASSRDTDAAFAEGKVDPSSAARRTPWCSPCCAPSCSARLAGDDASGGVGLGRRLADALGEDRARLGRPGARGVRAGGLRTSSRARGGSPRG
ncbi:MAG: ATP-binding protein [Deltaproteobacteria bacterium]|nr:ATP-binding protein [Deltaproteobacteria bacterium]